MSDESLMFNMLRSQKAAKPYGPLFLPIEFEDAWEASCRREEEELGMISPPGTKFGYKGKDEIFQKTAEVRFCREVFE